MFNFNKYAIRSGDELDVIATRRFHCYHQGEVSKIKRGIRRRARQMAKKELRKIEH